MERSRRLKRLAELQETVKAVHEFRRAGHLAAAARAEDDAEGLREAAEQPSPLAGMTAALYPRYAAAAFARADAARVDAAMEAERIAIETARGERLDVQRRAAMRDEERDDEERDRLEALEQALTRQAQSASRNR